MKAPLIIFASACSILPQSVPEKKETNTAVQIPQCTLLSIRFVKFKGRKLILLPQRDRNNPRQASTIHSDSRCIIVCESLLPSLTTGRERKQEAVHWVQKHVDFQPPGKLLKAQALPLKTRKRAVPLIDSLDLQKGNHLLTYTLPGGLRGSYKQGVEHEQTVEMEEQKSHCGRGKSSKTSFHYYSRGCTHSLFGQGVHSATGKPAQQDTDLLVLLKLIFPEESSIILCCSCKHGGKGEYFTEEHYSGFHLCYTFSNLQLTQSRSHCNEKRKII